jgi:hypothetical protein
VLLTAVLDVRVLPWRPRRRMMDPDDFVDGVISDGPDTVLWADDLAGVVVGIGVWLFLIISAPLIVALLAVLAFSVELPLVLALGLLLAVVRFAGIIPWTVLVVDPASGVESTERYRNLLHAVRRIREVNQVTRVPVRWSWA